MFELKQIHSNTLLESFIYLSKNSPRRIQSSFLELRNILNASYYQRVQATWNTDQDKIRKTQLVHSTLTSKILKTVGTPSYEVFSLHRPEETSMRLRSISTGAW